jgi:hypothetical protein
MPYSEISFRSLEEALVITGSIFSRLDFRVVQMMDRGTTRPHRSII